MKSLKTIVALSTLCFSYSAYAADMDADLRKEGYGDVADLYKSMPPEQQAEVMRQAAIKERELKAMPPEKVKALNSQLHNVNDTLYVDKVDPAKLDVSKGKSTHESIKEMSVYQKKYKQRKIENSVVKEYEDDSQVFPSRN